MSRLINITAESVKAICHAVTAEHIAREKACASIVDSDTREFKELIEATLLITQLAKLQFTN